MFKKLTQIFAIMALLVLSGHQMNAYAQEAAAGDAPAAAAAPAAAPEAGTPAVNAGGPTSISFWMIIKSGGFVGILLWILLLVTSIAGLALCVDSFITVRVAKVMPDTLVAKVKAAMEQGDVMKALKHCEEEPTPLSNILSTGFSNVEEGWDAIQDSVSVAADLESEKLMQRVNYLNVVGNLAPMLGLLGTVTGMINAFKNLGSSGAAAASSLAVDISQALWTTAVGLLIAVPALAFYYYFRNRAATIILHMEALTLDEIKVLRNVEVIED